MGNEKVHLLANSGNYKIRFEMLSIHGKWVSAECYYLVLDSETNFYRIHVGGLSGDVPDGMEYTASPQWLQNGMKFTTWDSDNDLTSFNCAVKLNGGWWYNGCYQANLNGDYYAAFQFWSMSRPGAEQTQCVQLNMSRIMIKPV